MTHRLGYTYATLRYIHDLSTGEFINVGVVLHAPSVCYFGAKLRHTHGRLSATFPDLDTAAFRASMRIVERALRTLAAKHQKDGMFPRETNAVALAVRVLPADDSSLQWSPLGSGVSKDPRQELEHLFTRLVAKYDDKQGRRRSDDDVWRPIRDKLDEAKLSDKLTPTVIRGKVDELSFDHAWKNGIWHCYRAISFDLSDADSIKKKARQWNGHLSSVRDADNAFKPYFVLGIPSDSSLRRAYSDAIAILKTSPVPLRVYEETEVDEFVEQIENDVRSHD